jgi:hypothetical protein
MVLLIFVTVAAIAGAIPHMATAMTEDNPIKFRLCMENPVRFESNPTAKLRLTYLTRITPWLTLSVPAVGACPNAAIFVRTRTAASTPWF